MKYGERNLFLKRLFDSGHFCESAVLIAHVKLLSWDNICQNIHNVGNLTTFFANYTMKMEETVNMNKRKNKVNENPYKMYISDIFIF